MHKLNEINLKYEAVGKSDSRLTEERDAWGQRVRGHWFAVAQERSCNSYLWNHFRSDLWDQMHDERWRKFVDVSHWCVSSMS